jgi:tetratricopeptide (TPR) repeat protein
MHHSFGQFELDEAARKLSLKGVRQKIQPLVFDLLVYLIRNAGRVVPKDELMEVLWPNVIVTEASLQRVVSLTRKALAAGGLQDAIQSYVRHGYRFAIDEPGLGHVQPASFQGPDDLAEARRLAAARDWSASAKLFTSLADIEALSPTDIDLWALVVECSGRPTEAIPVLARAVAAHIEAGDFARAARSAVTLAKIQAERGSGAVAEGWLEHAASLLSQSPDDSTQSYLLWMRSRLASSAGRPQEALQLASAAYAIAETCEDPGLRALTLTYKGFFNLALGKIDEGSEQQNHAAAIALSSQVDPITGSLVYCNILWSCRTFADWPRARQWSEGFESWCTASFAQTSGACDLHRAEVVAAQQILPEALTCINKALPKLSAEESWSLGEGFRVRGDIFAMIGDLAAARADYDQAYALGWDAEPGNALLLFETGDLEGALAAIDRALQGMSWFHLQRRGNLLVNAACIAARGGRSAQASIYLAEIDAQPERWRQPATQALIAETKAALCEPGDPNGNRLLLLARQLWTSAGVGYHEARVRLQLAKALLKSGDVSGAKVEITAAERSARHLGSRRLEEEVAMLRGSLRQDGQSPVDGSLQALTA